jgi:hypothetical protein
MREIIHIESLDLVIMRSGLRTSGQAEIAMCLCWTLLIYNCLGGLELDVTVAPSLLTSHWSLPTSHPSHPTTSCLVRLRSIVCGFEVMVAAVSRWLMSPKDSTANASR